MQQRTEQGRGVDSNMTRLNQAANCIAQLLPHQWQTVQFAPPMHRYIHIVFLAITPAGLADALRTAKADEAIWCGSDAMTEADYKALDRPHVSRFTYELGDRELIPDAIGTIEEHHPGQTVCVEAESQNQGNAGPYAGN